MITRKKLETILADPDFENRVDNIKNAKRFQGFSVDFLRVVQLVFEAFLDESIEAWEKEYDRSINQGDRPFFSAFVSLTIITSIKKNEYKPRLKKVLKGMFPGIVDAEWIAFDEVFCVHMFDEGTRFRRTHIDMAYYTARRITAHLMAVGEDGYIVVHSGIGVSVFD